MAEGFSPTHEQHEILSLNKRAELGYATISLREEIGEAALENPRILTRIMGALRHVTNRPNHTGYKFLESTVGEHERGQFDADVEQLEFDFQELLTLYAKRITSNDKEMISIEIDQKMKEIASKMRGKELTFPRFMRQIEHFDKNHDIAQESLSTILDEIPSGELATRFKNETTVASNMIDGLTKKKEDTRQSPQIFHEIDICLQAIGNAREVVVALREIPIASKKSPKYSNKKKLSHKEREVQKKKILMSDALCILEENFLVLLSSLEERIGLEPDEGGIIAREAYFKALLDEYREIIGRQLLAHRRFIRSKIGRLWSRNKRVVDTDDLIQEIYAQHLERSAHSHDIRLGQLTTYFERWVKKEMRAYLEEHNKTFRIPSDIQSPIREVRHRTKQYQQTVAPVSEQNALQRIKESGDMSADAIDFYDRLSRHQFAASLQSIVKEREYPYQRMDGDEENPDTIRHTRRENTVFDRDQTTIEDEMQENGLRQGIERVLKTLSYREREILRLRYGIGDGESYSYEEVANIFKVTRERIRQIEAKAIRKLQNPVRMIDLEALLTPEDSLEQDQIPTLSPLSSEAKRVGVLIQSDYNNFES